MTDKTEYIGYLRYTGKLVDDGLLDARKSAQALIGFDEAIRFFVGYQVPDLANVDYEIPVMIQKGSWEALIPNSITEWIRTALGAGMLTYATAAAAKMAQNDFQDVNIKSVFAKAIESIQWIIRIGVHVGDMSLKTFKAARFRNENKEIGIPNDQNEYLYVPKEYLQVWKVSNPSLLYKMTAIVELDREMTIGVIKNGNEERVNISIKEKSIFIPPTEDTEDVLFPELVHGQYVELEGSATRGNKNTNSLGFKYHDHILTCYPKPGTSIVAYKPALFLRCKIYGIISRADELNQITEKRPKIIFSNLVPIEDDLSQLPLFDEK